MGVMDSTTVNRASILLVTNNSTEPERLETSLADLERPIVVAKDTASSLALFKQEQPSLVILDFGMENEAAYTICHQLRQLPNGDDITILGIVAGDSNVLTRALTAGIDDYVIRPVHPLGLIRRVDNLLQISQARAVLHKVEQTQQRADQKYRNLFDSANDAIFIIDMLTGRLLDVNRRAVKWLGYSRDELSRMAYTDIEITDSRKHAPQELTTKGHFIFEQFYRTRHGHIIPAEVSSRIITHEGRRAILNVARDITRRKQVEDAESEQRKLAEALRDTAAAINSTLKLDEVIERILEQVAHVMPCEAANVMLIEGEYTRVCGQWGYARFDAEEWQMNRQWKVDELANFQWIVENARPLTVPDTHHYPDWHHDAKASWLRSYVGAPIIASNTVIGFLNLDHSVPNTFTDDHGEQLLAFANQASIAIQNARLHEAVQRHAEELEARVAQRTIELVQANLSLKEHMVERQRIEDELAEERNVLRTLIDNLPDEIYIKDTDGRIVLVNRALELRLGAYTPDGVVLGKTDYELVPPQVADYYREEDRQLITTGKVIINKEVSLPHDEGYRHLLATRIPLRDAKGSVTAIIGINHDITALHQADLALKAERNLLRTLIDNIPDEICVKDTDGKIILANRALIRRIGANAPNGEVIGSTDFDYLNENMTLDQAEHNQQREHALMQEKQRAHHEEIAIVDENMEKQWLLTTKAPLYDSDGSVLGLVSVSRNITEARRAEERLAHIVTSARCLLWFAIVEQHDEDLLWDIYVPGEEAARDFLPVHMESGQTFAEAWQQSILADDWERMNLLSKDAIHENSGGYVCELRCNRADGEIRWLHEDVQIRSLTPRRYSFVGVCTDITERKQAEETLQEANELLEHRVAERTTELSRANQVLQQEITERERAERAEREQRLLAEALTDTAAVLNETLDLNEVLDRILTHVARVVPPHDTAGVMLIEDDIYVRTIRFREYTADGVVTTPESDRFYLDSLPNLRRILDTDGPIIISDTNEHPDWITGKENQRIRSYIGMPIHAEGHIIGFINLGSSIRGQFMADHASRLLAFCNQAGVAIQNARLFEAVRSHATDLRRRIADRTAQLEYERAQLHAILDAMTEGVVYYDNDGNTQYVNQSLIRLTGYSAEEWIDSSDQWVTAEILDEKSREMLETIKEKVRRHGLWHGEVRMKRKNGATFDAKWITSQVTGSNNEPVGAVTVMRDISAEKRLEAQKARFIATASHELRTPIANLKTRLYLIEKQPEKVHNHLSIMEAVTDRMRKLVDDLLDISRFEHGIISLQREDVLLQELIDSVIQVQLSEADQKQITLKKHMPAAPLYIWADRSRITQVITNLVTNAINYTEHGGRVEVQVELAPPHDTTRYTGGHVLVHVRDTGIGIPAEMLPDVFKPFFRVNDYNNGVGLGLSISREIIELHNGEISVTSSVDEGTCFTVKLPLTGKVTEALTE
jgi:PAS domain S-box-containing protein